MTNSAAFKRASVPKTRSWRALWVAPLIPLLLAAHTAHARAPLPMARPEVPVEVQNPPAKPIKSEAVPFPVPKPAYRPAWAVTSGLAKTYGPAFELAAKRAWTKLAKLPRTPRDPALETALTWLRLEHWGSKTRFQEIARFLEAHPAWPRRQRLARRAEVLLGDDLTNEAKLRWFKNNPPTTTPGRLKWIDALERAGDRETMVEAVRDTWQRARLTRSEQRRFRRKHRAILEPTAHWRRMDRLLWLGASGAARAMMPLVSPERRRLAEARLRLRGMSGGVDSAVKRVPEALLSDSGLIYERLRWRHRKGLKDEALELLWRTPADHDFRPLWWKERSRQVRYALDSGRHEDAYLLAASHIQRSGVSFADAQWHAGWIALRYRDKPGEAAGYFTDLHKAVKTPISRARAAYWAGRAFDESGAATAARRWYALAAEHNTTFYGQIAATKVPSNIARLPSAPTPSAAIAAGPATRELIGVAIALSEIHQDTLARLFFQTAARAASGRDEAVWIAASARAVGYIDMGVYTARIAARSGYVLTEAGYPVIEVPSADAPEPALTLAVIRQESGFDEAARSRAGALGLMQLMPATARGVARGLRIGYGRGRLTADPDYNMRLGSSYLKTQLDKFGGDYVLALAAYNAGPHRVTRWLKERGDPRESEVDMIDWIERIPFAETRNYVQRVLESLHVYRLRLGSAETGWRMATAVPGASACRRPPARLIRCSATEIVATR